MLAFRLLGWVGPDASEPLVSDLLRALAADALAKYPSCLSGLVEGVGVGSTDTTLRMGKTRSVDPGLRWPSFPSSDRPPPKVEARLGGDLDLEASRSSGGHFLRPCVLDDGEDGSGTISDEVRRGVFELSPFWDIGYLELTAKFGPSELANVPKLVAKRWGYDTFSANYPRKRAHRRDGNSCAVVPWASSLK
jgi:hypothetical protein